ncbi:MAG: class I SAM-dependent methyltransferase [Burkholderiales bacterium]|nr:class I SAM-dependent methyltransferase [Burkholderiales bacterium]
MERTSQIAAGIAMVSGVATVTVPAHDEAWPERWPRLSGRRILQPLKTVLSSVFAIGCLLAAAGTALAQTPHAHNHSFGEAQKWSKVFDDPGRDAWQKPHEVIRALKLGSDAVVADIGAGTGYFAIRFAHMVPKGKVYGVDSETDMVRHLADRAQKEKLGNLIAITGSPDDPRIPEKADVAILVNVYHHIENRVAYFRKLQAVLKPDGRLAIIDFRMDSPIGPPGSARIEPERVRMELGRAGYSLTEEHGFLPNQYYLIFRPGKP